MKEESAILTDIEQTEGNPLLTAIQRWATSTPDAVALDCGDNQIDYAQLQARIQRVARNLTKLKLPEQAVIAVRVPRDENLLPVLLAIWSLRCAYVPIDPAYPLARQTYILQNSGASLLIAEDDSGLKGFKGAKISQLQLLQSSQNLPSEITAPSPPQASDLAYIIYTSGSTGNPKGVQITHANLSNFLLGMQALPGLTANDRLLAVTTISFDIHILELFLPLLVGARLTLASRKDATNPQALHNLIEHNKITCMQATPATWRMLLSDGWRPTHKLKILIGGEALPKDLLGPLHEASYELWNMYGPTETTVWSTCSLIEPNSTNILIGTPIRNTRIYVVDDRLQVVKPGVAGELLIGGDGVSPGYHLREDITAEKFITLPGSGVRVYRTGDLVTQHEDGSLEYINRVDNQIKLRGFRIEPLEIEQVLEQLPGVSQAVVVAADFTENDKRLLAFYLGAPLRDDDLFKMCQDRLPAHMIPQHFIHLREFPMTDNLKVDRKTLTSNGASYISKPEKVASNARDDLDLSLIAVWEQTLGIEGIGIDDDFFQLGGHSLLALRVLNEMTRATGLTFSPTAIFENSTIRSLVNHAGDQVKRAASVVKLNNAMAGEPIFCLCGVQIYQKVADYFDQTNPVFGVFASEEFAIIEAQQNNTTHQFSLDALIQNYTDAILRQGTFQKVRLFGFSFGGLMALEVAKKLRSLGVEVTQVALLDSYFNDSTYRSVRGFISHSVRFLSTGHFKNLAKLFLKSFVSQASEPKAAPLSEQIIGRERAFDRAAYAYTNHQKHYPFDVVLFKAKHTNFGFGYRSKRDYGLGQYIAGTLTIYSINANHTVLMYSDAVKDMCELLNKPSK